MHVFADRTAIHPMPQTVNPPAPVENSVRSESHPRQITVVLNPAAGRGQGGRRREELKTLLEGAARANSNSSGGPQWEIVETRSHGDGVRLAAEGAAAGAD